MCSVFKNFLRLISFRIIVEWTRGGERQQRGPKPERSDYRVRVENLPSSVHWQDMKDHFRKCGDVVFGDRDRNGSNGNIF